MSCIDMELICAGDSRSYRVPSAYPLGFRRGAISSQKLPMHITIMISTLLKEDTTCESFYLSCSDLVSSDASLPCLSLLLAPRIILTKVYHV
mmetsp:Transcript_14490/g.25955  ORF Transcript_14490/g.25955 Transcript_14490/m.25955 type:complete len:92 (+) Transcript_14490:874-1149(+)